MPQQSNMALKSWGIAGAAKGLQELLGDCWSCWEVAGAAGGLLELLVQFIQGGWRNWCLLSVKDGSINSNRVGAHRPVSESGQAKVAAYLSILFTGEPLLEGAAHSGGQSSPLVNSPRKCPPRHRSLSQSQIQSS